MKIKDLTDAGEYEEDMEIEIDEEEVGEIEIKNERLRTQVIQIYPRSSPYMYVSHVGKKRTEPTCFVLDSGLKRFKGGRKPGPVLERKGLKLKTRKRYYLSRSERKKKREYLSAASKFKHASDKIERKVKRVKKRVSKVIRKARQRATKVLEKKRREEIIEQNKNREEKNTQGKDMDHLSEKVVLQRWFGIANWIHNQLVADYRVEGKLRSLGQYRKMFINEEADVPLWVKVSPYEVRDGALRDFVKAVESNLAKKQENPKHHFDMKFRSKKINSLSIYVKDKAYKAGTIYHTIFAGNMKINSEISQGFVAGKVKPFKASADFPERSDHDVRLVRKATGKFYMCFSQKTNEKKYNMRHVAIALDPGVRTFMTGFTTEGEVYEFGVNDINIVHKLLRTIDKTKSLLFKVNSKKRYNMKKAMVRTQEKIDGLINELQKKTVRFLADNFDTVLLPKFNVKQMIQRIRKNKRRKISRDTARRMQALCHYKFRVHLQNVMGKRVQMCYEHDTSRTCTSCGIMNLNLGSNKTFTCPHCSKVCDRDIAAARNILLKNLSLLQESPLFQRSGEETGECCLRPSLDV